MAGPGFQPRDKISRTSGAGHAAAWPRVMMVHGRADLPLAVLARTVEQGSRRPGANAVGLSIDCRGSGWVQPLLNTIVWVTGAGSGKAAALTLAKAGGAVVLTGRRREPLETVAHRIRAEGGTAHVEPGDLMDPDAVKRIGAAINDKIGRLDILVN